MLGATALVALALMLAVAAAYALLFFLTVRSVVVTDVRADAVEFGTDGFSLRRKSSSATRSRSSASGYEVEEVALGESDDWMEQLLGSRVMHLMPNANLQEVLRKMEQVELAQGEEVFHQGDEGDYYYFINRGRCGLTRSEGDGEEIEIAQLGPGESFGEDALLSGSPRSCSIRMLSDGVLIRLSKENFDQLIKHRVRKILLVASPYDSFIL